MPISLGELMGFVTRPPQVYDGGGSGGMARFGALKEQRRHSMENEAQGRAHLAENQRQFNVQDARLKDNEQFERDKWATVRDDEFFKAFNGAMASNDQRIRDIALAEAQRRGFQGGWEGGAPQLQLDGIAPPTATAEAPATPETPAATPNKEMTREEKSLFNQLEHYENNTLRALGKDPGAVEKPSEGSTDVKARIAEREKNRQALTLNSQAEVDAVRKQFQGQPSDAEAANAQESARATSGGGSGPSDTEIAASKSKAPPQLELNGIAPPQTAQASAAKPGRRMVLKDKNGRVVYQLDDSGGLSAQRAEMRGMFDNLASKASTDEEKRIFQQGAEIAETSLGHMSFEESQKRGMDYVTRQLGNQTAVKVGGKGGGVPAGYGGTMGSEDEWKIGKDAQAIAHQIYQDVTGKNDLLGISKSQRAAAEGARLAASNIPVGERMAVAQNIKASFGTPSEGERGFILKAAGLLGEVETLFNQITGQGHLSDDFMRQLSVTLNKAGAALQAKRVELGQLARDSALYAPGLQMLPPEQRNEAAIYVYGMITGIWPKGKGGGSGGKKAPKAQSGKPVATKDADAEALSIIGD